MVDLSKIGERDRLKPRPGDEPHWQRLRAGCYVGYRPSKRGGKGTWFARAYLSDAGKLHRKKLGDYGSLSGHELFAIAKREAEAWFEEVASGGIRSEQLQTVGDACRIYLQIRPGKIAEGIFRRHVFEDVLGRVRLDRLRRHHLRDWRTRLEQTPALISRNKQDKPRTRPRSASTVNRDMVPLRAALGRVLSPGAPDTDAAWQEALLPNRGVGKRRGLYLDREERASLLSAASVEVRPFLRALCLLPLRPGALAKLVVEDFDNRTGTLTIGRDKNGDPRQVRIPGTTAAFLTQQTKSAAPLSPIFRRLDGRPWNKDAWKGPIKEAVLAAGLPKAATAYTLRHSIITDLITGGLPALTVAQISGTSIAMIESHYGHLVGEEAQQALARLSL